MPVFLKRVYDWEAHERRQVAIAEAKQQARLEAKEQGLPEPKEGPELIPAPADAVHYEKVIGELNELKADYEYTVRNKGTAKEVTILMERPKVEPVSVFQPTGYQESFCTHGEALNPITGKPPKYGRSWVPAGSLEIILRGTQIPLVKCHCEDEAAESPDMTAAALETFAELL